MKICFFKKKFFCPTFFFFFISFFELFKSFQKMQRKQKSVESFMRYWAKRRKTVQYLKAKKERFFWLKLLS